jgi:hypothetical protein
MDLIHFPNPEANTGNVIPFARIEGRDKTLEPTPLTLANLVGLYQRHGERREFLPHLVWYGDCASRLRRGLEPSVADLRRLATLKASLRWALR